MTTITSSSNMPGFRAMLRHDLGRIKLMSSLFFLLGFVSLPMQMALVIYSSSHYSIFIRHTSIYNGLSLFLFISVIFVFSVVIALQLMNYNFGRRSVDIYYTLPFTRRQMILSHLLSGFIGLVVPIGLNLGLTAVEVTLYLPKMGLDWLLPDLLSWSFLAYVLFVSVVMVACLMGNTTDTVLYAFLLNTAPILLLLAVAGTLGIFVLGFDPTALLSKIGPYTHPFGFCTAIVTEGQMAMEFLSIWGLGLWAVLLCAMLYLSVYFYEKRDAAMAEGIGQDNWFKLILKICAAYLFSVGFATMVFYTLLDSSSNYYTAGQRVVFLVGSLAGALLGYIILEVVFARGFKSIRGNWWICMADLAVSLSISLLAVTGLLGYETAIPAVPSIQSASFSARVGYRAYYSGLGTPDWLLITDPEALEMLTALHTQAIDSAKTLDEGSTSLAVEYRLNNGCTISRQYYGLTLNEQGTEQLRQLYTRDEIIRQVNPILRLGQEDTRLENAAVTTLDGRTLSTDRTTAQLLLEAAQQDLFHTLSQNQGYIGSSTGFLNLRYSYPAKVYDYENDAYTTEELYAEVQVPVLESFTNTSDQLKQQEIALPSFDAEDYDRVYANFSRYSEYQDPSTNELMEEMAYYCVTGYDSYLLKDQSGDIPVQDYDGENFPLLPTLTTDEVQLLYDASSPRVHAADLDNTSTLLFDTGKTGNYNSHLMLTRYISNDTLASLPAELLQKLGVRADGVHIQYIYELMQEDWPIAPQ